MVMMMVMTMNGDDGLIYSQGGHELDDDDDNGLIYSLGRHLLDVEDEVCFWDPCGFCSTGSPKKLFCKHQCYVFLGSSLDDLKSSASNKRRPKLKRPSLGSCKTQ